MASGGTPAPGSRMTAAAVALGAPKAPSKGRPGALRPPKARPMGRTQSVQHQEHPHATQHQGTAHPGSHAHLPGQQQNPRVFNPLGGFLNERQLEGVARNETNQALQPIKQREGEISNIEGTTSRRFSGFANAEQTRLGEIQKGQQEGAKTIENNVATAAMRGAGEVDTAGQQAAMNAGGYLAPEVRASLASAGQSISGVGGAQMGLASNTGVAESNFLTNMRAAAVQRATEGQANIPTAFSKQRAGLGQEEAKLVGGIPALASRLGQEQFKDYATAQGLNLKRGTLSLNQTKAAQGNARAEERNKDTAAAAAARNAAAERRNSITEELGLGKLGISQQMANTAASRARTYAQSVQNKLKGTGASASSNKLTSGIATAYAVVQELRSGEGAKTPMKKAEGAIRSVLTSGGAKNSEGKAVKMPRVADALLQNAALELWETHRISSTTQRQLSQRGFTAPSEWTNGSFRGF